MDEFVFSVFDVKAGAFLNPFIMPNLATAIRALTDCVTDDNHNFGKHPSDYTLFQLGTFNRETGSINYNKESVISLVELIPAAKEA